MLNPQILMSFQVIEYYRKKGIVADLQAAKPPPEVTVQIEKALKN